MLKKIFFAGLTFLGWILSPFTWWNDTFVNLPLAYVSASFFTKFFPGAFLAVFLIFYWLTNFLGILLMYIGAGGLSPKWLLRNKILYVLITVAVYSIISGVLIGSKIIKPF